MLRLLLKLVLFPFRLPFRVLSMLAPDDKILQDIEDDVDSFGEE